MFDDRNPDFQEAILEKDGQVVLRFAIANGFRNIQNLVQKLKRGKSPYDFVEIMACPSGKIVNAPTNNYFLFLFSCFYLEIFLGIFY